MSKYILQTELEKLLLMFPDKPWIWEWISENPNITMEMIEAHPDKPWNWNKISENPNITMEMIESHPDKPWNWYRISYKLNLTMKMIEAHPDKPWNWDAISANSFGWKSNNIYIYWEEMKQRVFEKNKIIEKELIEYTWHPDRMMNWCLDTQERKEIEIDWNM